jgi:hypothetical protein
MDRDSSTTKSYHQGILPFLTSKPGIVADQNKPFYGTIECLCDTSDGNTFDQKKNNNAYEQMMDKFGRFQRNEELQKAVDKSAKCDVPCQTPPLVIVNETANSSKSLASLSSEKRILNSENNCRHVNQLLNAHYVKPDEPSRANFGLQSTNEPLMLNLNTEIRRIIEHRKRTDLRTGQFRNVDGSPISWSQKLPNKQYKLFSFFLPLGL